MRTHRFGRKIKLPATIAIKHQIRMLMAQDEAKKAEAKLIDQSARRTARDDTLPLSALVH
jgi:TATA-binding protein-associated factor Taf7